MLRVLSAVFLVFLNVSSVLALTVDCRFEEKLNPAYGNRISCGQDSDVWKGRPFDPCEFPTKLTGDYISRLVLGESKGQIFKDWTQSFISYSMKKNGVAPKRDPYDLGVEVLFYHYQNQDQGKDYWRGHHRFILIDDIEHIWSLFVDERTGQSFLSISHTFGTGAENNRLSAWNEMTMGICNIAE